MRIEHYCVNSYKCNSTFFSIYGCEAILPLEIQELEALNEKRFSLNNASNFIKSESPKFLIKKWKSECSNKGT